MKGGQIDSLCIPLLGNSVCILSILQNGLNFSIKFGSSDPSFNRSILTLLHLKSGTSAHAQIAVIQYYILFTNFLS